MSMIENIPPSHKRFLDNASRILHRDERIVGAAIAGSLAESRADEFSDVDLVLAVEPAYYDTVMAERTDIAASLGNLAVAFTGEHVGEPRLLICLYEQPVLHVDLKFVKLPDATPVVDNPVLLWDRGGRLEAVLRKRKGAYPPPDAQWIEDRFWVWVHYFAGKIGRGELFEALEGLSFLRVTVLAPLGLAGLGLSSSGVRRLEEKSPELAEALAATMAEHDRESLWSALEAAVILYRRFRAESRDAVAPRARAEETAMRYVKELRARAAIG